MKIPAFLLHRKPNTNKYNYGYVLVLGGSPGLTGAPGLCAKAALKIGAGLVRAGVPASLNSIVEKKLLEVMSLPVKEKKGYFCLESFKDLKPIWDKVDVIAIGCGASQEKSAQTFICKVIKEWKKKIVIDADGLNALAGNLDRLKGKKPGTVVLTPHTGEFLRLAGVNKSAIINKRKELVKQFALRYNLTLVLKGNHTLISDGTKFFENTTGNPAMAKAGTGDVLTGIIAGLIAQGMDNFAAAKLGVYLHGLSADIAIKDKSSMCLLASDIIEYLPQAIKKVKCPGSSIGRASHL